MKLLRKHWSSTIAWTTGVLILVLYGGLFLRSMLRDPTLKHLIELLVVWQTQTGAAIAVAAAFIGARAVIHQTKTTERIEADKKARRAVAIRAVLPLTLAELEDYATRSAEIYLRLSPEWERILFKVEAVRFPPIPEGLPGRMVDLIEASDPSHGKPLIALIRGVQIHHSRMMESFVRAGRYERSTLTSGQYGSRRNRRSGNPRQVRKPNYLR